MMTRHRSRLLTLMLTAALVAAMSGCVREEGDGGTVSAGGGSDGLPKCPVGAHEKADGVVEVDLWHGLGAESQNNLRDLAKEFNAKQKKIKVNVKNQGESYDEVLRKYVAAIPSKQLPPIIFLEDTMLRLLVDTGTILPAEACEKADDFTTGQLPVVRNYYTSKDIYWPAYTNVSEPILYYNANHFRKADLDPEKPLQTLDEVRTAAEALKESGIKSPLALILNEWFIECWITGAGESVVNKNNGRDGLADKSTFDNPATHEIYTWINDMADDGLLEGFSATDGQINQYLALAQQNSSMAIETSTAATTIKTVLGGGTVEGGPSELDPDDIDLSAIDPVAGPFPGLEEPAQVRVSGGAFFLTNTSSDEEQAAAWEFMKFMWETDSQIAWHFVGSYLPTTQTVANDPEVKAYWEDDLAGKLLKVGYDELVAIDPDNPGPQLGPHPDYVAAIKNSLDRMVLKGDSVDSVIEDADKEIQEALTRYNEDNG